MVARDSRVRAILAVDEPPGRPGSSQATQRIVRYLRHSVARVHRTVIFAGVFEDDAAPVSEDAVEMVGVTAVGMAEPAMAEPATEGATEGTCRFLDRYPHCPCRRNPLSMQTLDQRHQAGLLDLFLVSAFGLDRPRRRVRAWLVPPRQVHALQHQRPRRRSGRGGRAAGARCSGNVHATLSVKTNAQGCARRGTLPPIAPTAVPRASPYVPGVCGRPSASSRRRDGQRRFAMRFAEYQVPQYQSMESSQKLSGESERRLVGFRSSMGCALVRSAL